MADNIHSFSSVKRSREMFPFNTARNVSIIVTFWLSAIGGTVLLLLISLAASYTIFNWGNIEAVVNTMWIVGPLTVITTAYAFISGILLNPSFKYFETVVENLQKLREGVSDE